MQRLLRLSWTAQCWATGPSGFVLPHMGLHSQYETSHQWYPMSCWNRPFHSSAQLSGQSWWLMTEADPQARGLWSLPISLQPEKPWTAVQMELFCLQCNNLSFLQYDLYLSRMDLSLDIKYIKSNKRVLTWIFFFSFFFFVLQVPSSSHS